MVLISMLYHSFPTLCLRKTLLYVVPKRLLIVSVICASMDFAPHESYAYFGATPCYALEAPSLVANEGAVQIFNPDMLDETLAFSLFVCMTWTQTYMTCLHACRIGTHPAWAKDGMNLTKLPPSCDHEKHATVNCDDNLICLQRLRT